MTTPGDCPVCKRRVRFADIQTCPNRNGKVTEMITPCICPGPGYCTKYARDMAQDDWDICSGAVGWLKEQHVAKWVKDTGPSCAYDGGPLLDEHGLPRKKRGCGCNGVPPVIALKNCSHPQMVASRTPGQDGCESRCAFFMALTKNDLVEIQPERERH